MPKITRCTKNFKTKTVTFIQQAISSSLTESVHVWPRGRGNPQKSKYMHLEPLEHHGLVDAAYDTSEKPLSVDGAQWIARMSPCIEK